MTENEAVGGEATIYYAMPTEPDDANAAALADHIEQLRGGLDACKALEAAGWKPRWCDNPGDNEFFEFAYEKRFAEEVDAAIELDKLRVGVDFVWDED